MKEKISGLYKKHSTLLFLALATSFLYGFFAPIELYLSNADEFWFDLADMLPSMIIMFVASFIIPVAVMLLIYHIHKKTNRYLTLVWFWILVCVYLQGNFLVTHLPGLDGESIDWTLYRTDTIISATLFIGTGIVILLCVKHYQFKNVYRVARYITIGLLVLMCVTIGIEMFSKKDSLLKEDMHYASTKKDEFLYSTDRNMIILLLDRVESSMVAEYLEEDPEGYGKIFDDFTYYRDAMGLYRWTKYSVPLIVSGVPYENKAPFEEYFNAAVKDSPLFAHAEENGYQMTCYDSDNFVYDEASAERFTNVSRDEKSFTSVRPFIASLTRLMGMRYAPFGLKQIFKADLVDFSGFSLSSRGEGDERLDFTWFDTIFHANVINAEVEFTDRKQFKFIHLQGAHSPFSLLEDLSTYDPDEVDLTEDERYMHQTKATLRIVDEYLKMLKENGIYDNSIIVVMSDHGHSHSETLHGRNPIFFAKGIDEHHPMKTSMAPISYKTDLMDGFAALMDGKASDEIFDVGENEERVRYFYLYTNWKDTSEIFEYTQTGRANDMETFLPTGRSFKRPENSWEEDELARPWRHQEEEN